MAGIQAIRHMELSIQAKTLRASGLFDEKSYPLLLAARFAKLDPAIHYLQFGEAKGIKPSPQFDPVYYAKRYDDVAMYGPSPVMHYIEIGRRQGRRALPLAGEFKTPRSVSSAHVLFLGQMGGEAADVPNEFISTIASELSRRVPLVRLQLEPALQSGKSAGNGNLVVVAPEKPIRSKLDALEQMVLLERLKAEYEVPYAIMADPAWAWIVPIFNQLEIPFITVFQDYDELAYSEDAMRSVFAQAVSVVCESAAVFEKFARNNAMIAAKAFYPANRQVDGVAALAASVVASGSARTRIAVQEKLDIDVISRSDLFDALTYFGPNSALGGDHAIKGYVENDRVTPGSASFHMKRKPYAGFHPGVYAGHAGEALGLSTPFAHYLASARPPGKWARQLLEPAATFEPATNLRVAMYLHVADPDLVDQICPGIASMKTDVHILVSGTTDGIVNDAVGRLETAIEQQGRADSYAAVVPLSASASDSLPILDAFQQAVARRYDVVGFFVLKREAAKGALLGDGWRKFSWEHFVGTAHPNADRILSQFESDPNLALVFPAHPRMFGWVKTQNIADTIAEKLDLRLPLPGELDFPVGGAFWARTETFKRLAGCAETLRAQSFPAVEAGGAIERLLTVIADEGGQSAAMMHVPGTSW